MILQSTDELEKQIGNKYSLVIVAAKRARQLKEGHAPLATDPSPNPISLALREIQEGQIGSIAPPVEEVAPAPRDLISDLVTGADFDLDEDLDLEDSDAVDDLAALLVGEDDETEEEEAEADTDDDLATDDDTEDSEDADESDEAEEEDADEE
ncbi:MAG: DNA-directed RNA polymerase subunit omega [Armatimonadota bacterium]